LYLDVFIVAHSHLELSPWETFKSRAEKKVPKSYCLNELGQGEDHTWRDRCSPRQQMWSITCSIGRTHIGRCSRTRGLCRVCERVLGQACTRVSMRLLAYCVMSNHWHLVIWPRRDGDLSRCMNWLLLTHTQRWHQHRRNGQGRTYVSRLFHSVSGQMNKYLLTVCRDVMRNPVRAGLVE